MSNDVQPHRDNSGWTFRFDDPTVTQLRIDHRFTLVLDDGTLVVLEEPFQLRHSTRTTLIPAGDDPQQVADALQLLHSSIEELTVAASGELAIRFDNGLDVVAPVHPSFENWQIMLPDGAEWIGLPGGGVHRLAAP